MTLVQTIAAMVLTGTLPNVACIGYHHYYGGIKLLFAAAWCVVVTLAALAWAYGAMKYVLAPATHPHPTSDPIPKKTHPNPPTTLSLLPKKLRDYLGAFYKLSQYVLLAGFFVTSSNLGCFLL